MNGFCIPRSMDPIPRNVIIEWWFFTKKTFFSGDYTIRLQSLVFPVMEIRFPIIICQSKNFWRAAIAFHWATIVKSMISVVSFNLERLSTRFRWYSSETELIERFAMHGTQKACESQILWFVLSMTKHISPMSEHKKITNCIIFLFWLSHLREIMLIYQMALIWPPVGSIRCHLEKYSWCAKIIRHPF